MNALAAGGNQTQMRNRAGALNAEWAEGRLERSSCKPGPLLNNWQRNSPCPQTSLWT